MKALDEAFERATLEIARSLWPKGWRISAYAPKTLDAMVAGFRATGGITVSSLHSERTVFSSPEGNYAFRAWHDWHHIRLSAGLDRDGETLVHDAMARDLRHWEGWQERSIALLECENIGQLDYWERFGNPPNDQRAFACGYLAACGLL
jgi:hypothetical protein